MMTCAGCGNPITFTEADGWRDARDVPFCGPGRTAWHAPLETAEEIAADAEAFVAELRATAIGRGRFAAEHP